MAKQSKIIYVCQECGNQEQKWNGQCRECGKWNTFIEEKFRPVLRSKGNFSRTSSVFRPVKLLAYREIDSQDDTRTASHIEEFDRVLGGGIVAGSLVLIGGSPGIGKSTLVSQVSDKLSQTGGKVLYVSGEESERQIKMRGERLQLRADKLFLLTETNLEVILTETEKLMPDFVIVDSVQTIFSSKLESAPGSISQVREIASEFMIFAKGTATPVFLIGHVTKDGSIAGPKALEHIVDTVLYFEGDRHHNHRIVRATKNRFGAANEIGVFEMTNYGLIPVENPSEVFLRERPKGASGSVVTVCMEGSRPVPVEVQALVTGTKFGSGRRMAQGFDYNRTSLLIAVLEKRLGFGLANDDVFINIAGGLEIDEPAADLGIIAAVSSSFKNLEVPPDTAVFGEIGLTGEVRGVLHAQTRAREAQTLGFKKLILPESNKKGLEKLLGIRIVGVKNLEEAMGELF